MYDISLRERPALTDAELNALFAASWPGHEVRVFGPVLAHSLTYFVLETIETRRATATD